MSTPEFNQKLTPDEAVEALADRSNIDPNAKKYFGEKLHDDLLNILEDNDIFELDAMYLQGDLTIAEMEEYLILLPEYHQLMRRLKDWADSLIQHVTRRLEGTLRESVDKHGRLKNNQGLARMQRSVFNMIESFDNKGYATKRNSLVHFLKNYLGQALITDIWYRVVSNPQMQQYRRVLEGFIGEVDRNFMQNHGFNYPGVTGLKGISAFRSSYSKHHGNFNRFLIESDTVYPNNRRTERLPEQIDGDFEQIHELSHFRRIDDFSQRFGNVEVRIYGDPSGTNVRSSHLAFVKISFPGANPDILLKPGKTNEDGSYPLNTVIEHDSFQFVINRHDGSLTLSNSALPLDKQLSGNRNQPFMTENEFLRMKAVIFRVLREYLEDKPETITPVFFKKTDKATPLQEDTKQKVKEAIPEDPISETIDPPEHSTYEYTPYEKPPTPEPSTEEESEETPTIIQDIRLDGSYDEEQVVSTICRITKMPILKSARNRSSGKGSHVVVQGSNGANFLLPRHSRKDISLRILKKCLIKLEIPYSVFKREY